MGAEFLDIHSHILPGVDDGASAMAETLGMLQIAYAEGVRTIVATPHYLPGRHNKRAEDLRRIHREVCEQSEKSMPDLKILLGNEIYFNESAIEDVKKKKALTLADTDYVLIEFSVMSESKRFFHAVRVFSESGYRPVLAHVERYASLYKKEETIRELIDAGAYIQINAESFAGGFMDRHAAYCRKLLELGMVHFIGSDCHNLTDRKPRMHTPLETLKKGVYTRQIEKIMSVNQDCFLHNKYIQEKG